MMSDLPVLYSFRRCPYAMRARLGLLGAAIKVELREIILRHKPLQMLDASPKGTVPVLILPHGKVIDESLDIMLFALELHDKEGWLTPDSGTLTQMLDFIEALDKYFKPQLDAYKYPDRFPHSDPYTARESALCYLEEFEQRLSHHAYVFGQNACLGDMATFPFIRQYAHVDKDWFRRNAPPRVQQWLKNHLESTFFQSVMDKYTTWKQGDPPTIFPQS